MRIGVLGHSLIGWGGGLDFLRLIVASLLAADSHRPHQLHILLPTQGVRMSLENIVAHGRFAAKYVIYAGQAKRHKMPPREIILGAFAEFGDRLVIHEIDSGFFALKRAVGRLGLDVLVPSIGLLPTNIGAPWVGYVFDFQHKYLPHFFTDKDKAGRDQAFSTMLLNAKTVVVNAQSVASDIDKFIPEATAKVFVLPFSPAPHPSWFDTKVDAASTYGITSPYFMISNQFWIHKDHGTAFKAFAQIASTFPDVMLVCTGETSDHRAPNHVSDLVALLETVGIRARVKILGLIPKQHQVALLRDALAVVQPTLFEGTPGGGATLDAVSLGVPVLLSDIPVNHEVISGCVRFFKTADANSLAQAMRETLNKGQTPRPKTEELIALGQSRREACGRVLMDAINTVLDLTK
jgi:glycosyltransferase involved in cell wall biosynthesis